MNWTAWNDRVTVAPTAEPISNQQAKDHLRVDQDDENDYIDGLIKMAREQVESDTSRALMPQTRALTLDRFPGDGDFPIGSRNRGLGGVIVIPCAPVQSISSVQYVDSTGATQTLSASLYTYDVTSEPARITPVYGQSWPTTLSRVNAVTITYIAGFTNAAAVPEKFKQLTKLWISHFYELRTPISIGVSVAEIPFSLRSVTSLCKWGNYT